MMWWRRPWMQPQRITSMTSFSRSHSRSGISTAEAPAATPVYSARWPALRPMTSTTETRSWLWPVSRSLSMAVMAVLQAVSNPMVYSVQPMSLSMVAGMPTTRMP